MSQTVSVLVGPLKHMRDLHKRDPMKILLAHADKQVTIVTNLVADSSSE